jgi:hypothetical protein
MLWNFDIKVVHYMTMGPTGGLVKCPKMFALLAKQRSFPKLSDAGYIEYGDAEFDGQGSGDDFYPGGGNNSDGGRSHTYTDYRQH